LAKPRLELLEDRTAPAILVVDSILDSTTASASLTLREAILLVDNGGNANTALGRSLTTGESNQITGTFGSNDTIQFDPSVNGQTIRLAGSELLVSRNLTINGPGATQLAVSGSSASRVFEIGSAVTASLSGLGIENGDADYGGGIYNAGTLTISNSSLGGNVVSLHGGGIYNAGTLTISNSSLSGNSAYDGGGLLNQGTLTVSNSTFSSNSALHGGGIFNNGTLAISNGTLSGNSAAVGGGIDNNITLTISNSTLNGNSATSSGGGISNGGTLTVSNSTVSSNAAGFYGGGLYSVNTLTVSNSTLSGNSANVGGGIYDANTLTVSNSTLSGNTASGEGGGIWFISYASAPCVLTNATIAANRCNTSGAASGNQGGGLWDDPTSTTPLTLNNTIIAGNYNGASGTTADDIGGTLNSASAYNLIGTGGSGGLQNGVNGNHVGVSNLGLATLADNGGSTQTVALLTGSPAIGAGSAALAVDASGNPWLTDQRGFGFLRTVNGKVDIGAFQTQPSSLTAQQYLQTALNQTVGALLLDSSGNPNAVLTLGAQNDANTFTSIFSSNNTNPLMVPTGSATPIDISVSLASGIQLNEAALSIPTGFRVSINGGTWYGGSPALILQSGTLTVTNATFQNATDAPTILVTGGTLTLRNDVVQSSTGYGDPAIEITGGTLDLGTTASPGGNTININGGGSLIQNQTTTPILASGDTFQNNGVVLTTPQAFPDSYTTHENTSLTVGALGVLANDIDPNGNALTAVLATAPANGTVVLNADGSFTYSAAANFAGTDSFTYQAKSANGTLSAPTTVTITVLPSASQLVLIGLPSQTNAGVLQSFSVTAEDSSGRVVIDYAGAVHFASSDPAAVFPNDYTFVGNDRGVHTFSSAASWASPGTQTLTATDLANNGVKSVAQILVNPPGVYTVTNALDDGSIGSLRWAITKADADTVPLSTINFSIGSGVQTIQVGSSGAYSGQPLPNITHPVMIDASTEPGYAGVPIVVLDGTNAGSAAIGLDFTSTAPGGSVKGLVIDHFSGNGIELDGGNNLVADNYIGVDATGGGVAGNGGDGVLINNASGNTIGGSAAGMGNVISGNGGNGVAITGSAATGNVVAGNYVGTDATGSKALGAPLSYGFSGGLYGQNANVALNIPQLNTSPGAATTVSFWMDWNGTDANRGIIPIGFSDYVLSIGANFGASPAIYFRIDAPDVASELQDVASINGLADQWHFITMVFVNTNVAQDQLWIDGVEQTLQLQPGAQPVSVSTSAYIGSYGKDSDHSFDGALDNVAFFNQQLTPTQIQAQYAASVNGTTSSTILSQGPVAYYPLNETSGTVAHDVSGNGNDGTISARYVTVGIPGGPTGNQRAGVAITGGASGNTIGGTATGARNVISGNGSYGVEISDSGTSANVVENNFLGLGVDGATVVPNTNDGVFVTSGATGNVIGDVTGGTRNIISGNRGSGVEIRGTTTTGNQIAGNIIGLDASGSMAVGAPNESGNLSAGVVVDSGASGNTIGGLTGTPGTGAGNVISGNDGRITPFIGWSGDGVVLTGADPYSGNVIGSCSANVVEGNVIGLDASGSKGLDTDGISLGNLTGVEVLNGTTNNIIGGSLTGARNIISNNGNIGGAFVNADGITLFGTYNLVAGNFIGTDVTGTKALGNGNYPAVRVGGAHNTIGGTTTLARNVVSGNVSNYGAISDFDTGGATNDVIEGNFIGTDVTGNVALSNTGNGVYLTGNGNTVGGTTSGAGNLIAASGSAGGYDGVDISGNNNLVQGNIIGQGANGNPLPNYHGGVGIGGSNNTIGGTTPGAGNVIRNNRGYGFSIDGSGNAVAGNDIEANGSDGVQINYAGTNNTIGGTSPGSGNVISGNGGDGVIISDSGTTGNLVEGNLIGTDSSGTAIRGNGGSGVLIENGAANNTVGGTISGAGNVISGNGGDGVTITSTGTTGNVVAGNFVGTDATGNKALGASLAYGFNTSAQVALNIPQLNTNPGAATTVSFWMDWNGYNYQQRIPIGFSNYWLAIDSLNQPNSLGHLDFSTDTGSLYDVNSAASLADQWHFITAVFVNGNVAQDQLWIDGTQQPLQQTGTPAPVSVSTSAYIASYGEDASHNFGGALDDVAFFDQQLTPAQIQAEYAASLTGTVSATILNQGPVAYYPLNETSASVAHDASGNGNNGAVSASGVALGIPGGPTGNLRAGVAITGGATGNTIGGSGGGARNVISGNGTYGVELSDSGTSANVVANNYIGLGSDGATVVGNTNAGVLVTNTATGNIIGDPTGSTRNIISGNRSNGVEISGSGTSGNQVVGNIVGLDVSGTRVVGAPGQFGNQGAGVVVDSGASGNTIGGLTGTPGSGAGNVISGNNGLSVPFNNFPIVQLAGDGVAIIGGSIYPGGGPNSGSSGNVVEGNIVGLDVSGTKAVDANGNSLGNASGLEVLFGATNNTVGGNIAGARNIISNNGGTQGDGDGVTIAAASNNLVAGNYIGTDVTGTVALGNAVGLGNGGGSPAVRIDYGAQNNTIGGTTALARNVIGGNNSTGVEIDRGGSGNLIEGNFIGTNAAGSAPLPNRFGGVGVVGGGSGNIIGGTQAGAGNLISNNSGGVSIFGGSGSNNNNLVEDNLITSNQQFGVRVTGNANVIAGNQIEGNGSDGVELLDASTNNTIGGSTPGLGNVISGNGRYGVYFWGSAPVQAQYPVTGNVVLGNQIANNSSAGVRVDGAAASNTVGGTTAGFGNVISGNGGDGVIVSDNGTTGNSILGNSIDDNAGLGINLVNGSNDNQAAPVLTSDSLSGGLTLNGTLAGAAGTTYRIEFFSNQSPDPSGFGEGQTFLGFATPDSSGHFQVIGLQVPAGQPYITATATNLTTGDTSSFSHFGVPTATALSTSVNPTIPGQPVTFTTTVTPAVAVSATPTGSVDFVDTTTNTDLGTAPLIGGAATLTPLSPLSLLGTHVIQAVYSGDVSFMGSSSTLNQTVTQSVFVLSLTASGALSLSGTSSINVPGVIVVDSSSKTALTEASGGSMTAASIRVVGGVSISGTVSPAPSTGAAVVHDPLAGLAAPTSSGTSVAVNLTKGQLTIDPGVYSAITVSGKTAALTMNPGTYIIEGGGFTVSTGGSVSGTGVTIYNTANAKGTFGGITLGAGVTVNLTAPAGGPYAGLVIFQDRGNTRAISLGNNGGLTGTIYAKAALLSLSNSSAVNGALVVDRLQLLGNAASTQTATGTNADGAGSTAGELLAGNLEVYVNDPSAVFTGDELARIQDAVNAVDAVVEPYGVSVTETTDPTAANVTVEGGSTSAAGGYADGVLGCYTTAGEITLIQGWNWYAGSNPTQIGAAQYDFETTVTHELGHALGLGESSDPTSAMSGTLTTGTVIRTLTTADLNIPYADAAADAQHAAGFDSPEVGRLSNPSYALPSNLTAISIPDRDAFFALLTNPASGSALAPKAFFQPPAHNKVFADSTGDVGTMLQPLTLASATAAPIYGAATSADTDDDLFAGASVWLQEGSEDPTTSPEPAANVHEARFDFIPAAGANVFEE
jgi:hypothetical protein